jgi:hypothetical protein
MKQALEGNMKGIFLDRDDIKGELHHYFNKEGIFANKMSLRDIDEEKLHIKGVVLWLDKTTKGIDLGTRIQEAVNKFTKDFKVTIGSVLIEFKTGEAK